MYQILAGEYRLDDDVEQGAAAIIEGCLRQEASQRFDLNTIMQHEWYTKDLVGLEGYSTPPTKIQMPLVDEMQQRFGFPKDYVVESLTAVS